MRVYCFIFVLLSTIPVFAEDPISYEEFPECFFHVDHINTYKFNEGLERDVWIDTCNKSNILEPAYDEWPKPVNDLVSIDFVHGNLDTLFAENAIYTNQFAHIQIGSKWEADNIVIPRSEYIEMKELTISDIKNEYQALYMDLKKVLDTIGNNKIYAYGYYKIAEDSFTPTYIGIQFQIDLSFKYIKNIIESVGLNIYDGIVRAQVSVIEKQDNSILQIQANNIITTNLNAAGDYEIYDLIGNQVLHGTLQKDIANNIDISKLRSGVYFFKTKNNVVKFIKVAE